MSRLPDGCVCAEIAEVAGNHLDDDQIKRLCDAHVKALAARASDGLADKVRAQVDALNEAADAIQALHPGEVKNSVTFLRARADALLPADTQDTP